MNLLHRQRPGYVFLISVLAVGAIVTLIVAVLLLLASSIARSTISLQQSARALSMANTCIERALSQLYNDPSYSGGIGATFSEGTCTIQAIAGYGYTDRTICVEGQSGTVTRHFEVDIASIYPSYVIRSWKEVASLTACE